MFRAVVQDGLIVINTHGALPDGTLVEVIPRPEDASRPSTQPHAAHRSKSKQKKTAKRTERHPLFGFGMWKDRTDIGDTAEFSRELRARASRRGPGV